MPSDRRAEKQPILITDERDDNDTEGGDGDNEMMAADDGCLLIIVNNAPIHIYVLVHIKLFLKLGIYTYNIFSLFQLQFTFTP